MKHIIDNLLYYTNNSVKKVYAMPSTHLHFYDLTFVLEGEMNYRINGKHITLRKNDVLFLTPGAVRERLETPVQTHYVSFNFLLSTDTTLPFNTIIHSAITTNIRYLFPLHPKKVNLAAFNTRDKISNILNYIILELIDNNKKSNLNNYVINAVEYINNNIYSKITLNDISDKLHITKEYLSTVFKKEMGQTITDYINGQKMNIAKEIIMCRAMSLSKISSHLGYDDYNYFSRLFKKYHHITPLAFKKNIENL